MATEKPPLQHQIVPEGTGNPNMARDIAAVIEIKSGGDQVQYKPTWGSHIIPLLRVHNHVQ